MKIIKNYLDKTFYPEFSNNWDDWLFRKYVLNHLTGDQIMLDIGAGAGIIEAMNFKGYAKKIYGLDPDHRVKSNPYLDEGFQGFGENLPFEDNMFDIVIMDNVAEHLVNPDKVFSEIFRVLKSGGELLLKTPNKYHYMPLAAIITPTSFHQYYNRLRGREIEDTFPTAYKANTRKSIQSISSKIGFKVSDLILTEGRPEYMRVSIFLYIFGIIYERIVNSFELFKGFRVLIIGILKKP